LLFSEKTINKFINDGIFNKKINSEKIRFYFYLEVKPTLNISKEEFFSYNDFELSCVLAKHCRMVNNESRKELRWNNLFKIMKAMAGIKER
jgi:hypothetical protein